MRTIVETARDAGEPPPLLMALLTGTYSEPEDFVREGFPQALRERGVRAEVVMAGVRAAWVADGSIVERLEDHVVAPGRSRGRTRIWLAGISLGGLAALGYAARRAHALEGIALISPYPATREVLREVDEAGGLSRWVPDIPAEGDIEREAWRWLATRGESPVVVCYFASGDRFVEGQRRLAAALAPGCARELPGGHDWSAWRALWEAFLADRRTMLQ